MKYILTIKSDNVFEVEKIYGYCYLIPCEFKYEKVFPVNKNSYKRVITISFVWIRWDFKLLLRKPRKK